MNNPMWHTLRVGTGSEIVLVVDFSADAGREAAGFSDLVPLLPDRYTVQATRRTTWTDDADGTVDPTARLQEWLSTADLFGPEVVAVLGYCAGCRLSVAFADRIAGPIPPAVVLFDPLPVVPQSLWQEYAKAVTQLAPGLGEAVVDQATERARAEAEAATGAGELARWLSGSYADLAPRGCEELGIDVEFAEQLISRLTGYLRYLAIAAAAPLSSGHAPALVLRSQEPVPSELLEHADARQLEHVDARQLDTPRVELLRSQEAADLVTRLLAGRSRDATGSDRLSAAVAATNMESAVRDA
ncbi:hypothetical protein [Micromonospora rubida]|uniref:hypothetical protein n=1 Tax=Micromonospora rubida TaxID=2697657 RepID=UPI0013769313|nr:hypothetical protein [Micromonospora rubida]NBE84047.1 hypothetical protein [Micromonospora rubida]